MSCAIKETKDEKSSNGFSVLDFLIPIPGGLGKGDASDAQFAPFAIIQIQDAHKRITDTIWQTVASQTRTINFLAEVKDEDPDLFATPMELDAAILESSNLISEIETTLDSPEFERFGTDNDLHPSEMDGYYQQLDAIYEKIARVNEIFESVTRVETRSGRTASAQDSSNYCGEQDEAVEG